MKWVYDLYHGTDETSKACMHYYKSEIYIYVHNIILVIGYGRIYNMCAIICVQAAECVNDIIQMQNGT